MKCYHGAQRDGFCKDYISGQCLRNDEYCEFQIEKIKPCPFCGSSKINKFYDYTYIGQQTERVVFCMECENCGANGPYYDSDYCNHEKIDSTEGWNRRLNK